ncbi:hypothetical protein CEXT_13881 [Caerostris extrusa]|uniref:Uncharacterized protein n=1 Tax=Caerostris extrusa TaxID=172846 RepID=A0AAV4XFJ0_CAEEX|nr:hypothetical protein CEXT_13881 [Caerostris extrusa]
MCACLIILFKRGSHYTIQLRDLLDLEKSTSCDNERGKSTFDPHLGVCPERGMRQETHPKSMRAKRSSLGQGESELQSAEDGKMEGEKKKADDEMMENIILRRGVEWRSTVYQTGVNAIASNEKRVHY